jgi:predicted ATP-grasp superfamily ATP-dependent carboligase
LAISDGREELAHLTRLAVPPAETVARALDRRAFLAAASHVGLEPARTISCENATQALAAGRELGFPVVVKATKAASSRRHATEGAPKSRVAGDAAQLVQVAAVFSGPMLVQAHIPGELVSFAGVIAAGELLAIAASRYQRTWPPPGGSASCSQTIEPPPGLAEQVVELLAGLGWEGVFELELIQTPDGAFAPIDLNPRPYGSMALACAAGAPIPALWCRWMLGDKPAPARARAGCRYRWEDGDLRHAAWQARHGHVAAALRVARPLRAVTHANFERRDPLPLFAQGAYLLRGLLSRRSARARGATAWPPS